MKQTFTELRPPLGQICKVPDHIISVYSLEKHIWGDNNSAQAVKIKKPELKTIEEFEIDPVRHFLNDILRNMAAPYTLENKASPIGQGYWVQAEFGSGKSHLLCFLGALALGSKDSWEIIKRKEEKAGKGKRESLYQFWENGLKQKIENSNKGILVVAKTLVGSGGGTIGLDEPGRAFAEYLIDAVKNQLQKELDKNISLYPAELLVDRFLKHDIDRYRKDLEKFLKDPTFFEEDEFEELSEFITNMQEDRTPEYKRSCGNKLWRFYDEFLKVRPQIDSETEDVLQHLVESVLNEGYCGILFLIDEVSLFMKDRDDAQKTDDEKTLVVLSNRLAKVKNLPVWTVCAAQQVIESKTAGTKNIIADDRLKLVPLLQEANDYYTIVLSRVRELKNPKLIMGYYNYYKRSFSWPSQIGYDEFERFFPFHKTGIEVLRDITMELTTARSAIHFMHQTLKYSIKMESKEIIRLWHFFDEALEYEEDPSGTYAGLVAIKTKRDRDYKIYESCKKFIDEQTKGPLRVHRERAVNTLQVLFLYYISKRRLQGLTAEEIANEILTEKNQNATLDENIQHYEYLANTLKKELQQIMETVDENGKSRYKFTPVHTGIDPNEEFRRIKIEVEANEQLRKEAWETLLEFKEWPLKTRTITIDLSCGVSSIFSEVASNGMKEFGIQWLNGEIFGFVSVRDLSKYIAGHMPFPILNTEDTECDFQVIIGKSPIDPPSVINLLSERKDPRIVIWIPDALKQDEQDLVNNFATYKKMIENWSGKETSDAKTIIDWVSEQLKTEIGRIVKVVSDSYQRGRMDAFGHRDMGFKMIGNLSAILTPIIDRILNATYESRIIKYPSNIPFCKEDAVKVINGIVTKGEIPTNVKLGKNESAAQNFGSSLMITSSSNWRKLDTSNNPFIKAIWKFIDTKIDDPNKTINLVTIYKNFMGLNGPEEKNYGLTKRVIDIYLLCLVKQGKIRINLGPRSPLSTDYIDYSSIEQIDFNSRIISNFSEIQKMVKPENWDVLRPYLEVILNENIPSDCNDSQITALRTKLVEYYKTENETSKKVLERSTLLFEKIKVDNPYNTDAERVYKLFSQDLGKDEINGTIYALKVAFNYKAFDAEKSDPKEIDDLKVRLTNYTNIKKFLEHENDLIVAKTYGSYPFPNIKELKKFNENLTTLKTRLNNLQPYIDSNTKLRTELIGDPLKITGDPGTLYGLVEEYSLLYKALHENVLNKIGLSKKKISDLTTTEDWKIVKLLQNINSLQPKKAQETEDEIEETLESFVTCPDSSIFSIESKLRTYPEHDCGLSFENFVSKLRTVEQEAASTERVYDEAIEETVSFFLSKAIKDKLNQGKDDPIIAELINCNNEKEVLEYFKKKSKTEKDLLIAKINRYLKKIKVRLVKKGNFDPTIKTIEESQLDQITKEFREFLKNEFEKIDRDDDTLPMLQLD